MRGPERDLPETITVTSTSFPAGRDDPGPLHLRQPGGLAAARPARGCRPAPPSSPCWSTTPTPPGGTYVHWAVAHLDPGRRELAEGAVPPGATELPNSAGEPAYAGPCPPGGPAHHYRFTLYAAPQRVDLPADAARPTRSRHRAGATPAAA